MPMLLRTVGEVMRETGRDALFVQFGDLHELSAEAEAAEVRHLAWFESMGIGYERTAPDYVLEGKCNLFAVHFGGPDDPRVAEYSAIFEDADGRSLNPDAYQMNIYSYRVWKEHADKEADMDESGRDAPGADG